MSIFLPTRSLPRAATLTSYISRTIWRFNSTTTPESAKPTYEVSSIPPNPLGEGNKIKTAAFLSIGGVGQGAFMYRNSSNFSNFCFTHEIALQRVETISNDENQIVDSVRRLADNYDIVITSGGTGSLEKDITYASLAKAFNQPLQKHAETSRRMEKGMGARNAQNSSEVKEEPTGDREKMTVFPAESEVLFVNNRLWMPVIRIGHVYALPGIPIFFRHLLDSLTPYIHLPERDRAVAERRSSSRSSSRSSRKSSKDEKKESSG